METIGIVASDTCTQHVEGKRWFHLRKFIDAYHDVMSRFRIVATDNTARIIKDTVSQIPNCSSKQLEVAQLGDSFKGVVTLAAMVARGDVRRVLMFQDPKDLDIERPERYALLRNCNLSGSKLHINASAHLWALFECKRLGIIQTHPYYTVPINAADVKETIAFIAHDREKPRMGRFALHYRSVLRTFPRLIATSGTKKHIDEFLKNTLPPSDRLVIQSAGAKDKESHGPAGGDVIIADEIFATYGIDGPACRMPYYTLHHILFFIDHKNTHPHEPDIQVLLRTCANPEHRVNLILNSRMAEEWAERYRS